MSLTTSSLGVDIKSLDCQAQTQGEREIEGERGRGREEGERWDTDRGNRERLGVHGQKVSTSIKKSAHTCCAHAHIPHKGM